MLFSIEKETRESLCEDYGDIFVYVYRNLPFKIKKCEEKKINYFSLKYSLTPEDMFFYYICFCFEYVYDFFYHRLNEEKRYDLIVRKINPYSYYFTYHYFVRNFLNRNSSYNLNIEVDRKNFELKKKSKKMLNDFFDLLENNSVVSFSKNHLRNLYTIFIYVEKYLFQFTEINMKKRESIA